MRTRLALSIPSYGRADAVAENLALVAEEAWSLGVDIYFSDDTNDASVENVVRAYADRYSNIRYRRNTPSLGHDGNVLQSLTWPDADYVWLLGDVWRPARGRLSEIVSFLDDQDMVFLNRNPPTGPNIKRLDDPEATAFLREKLWNQTLTAATIYASRVCQWVRDAPPAVKRNFPQLSVIMGYAGQNSISVGWVAKSPLEAAHSVGSYWYAKALDVFVDDWSAIVLAHETIIPAHDVRRVVRSHSLNTGVFNGYFLLSLRKNRVLTWSSTRKPYFWDAMHLPRSRVIGALLLPPIAARLWLKARRTFHR